ncbi:MAG: hypothetical protein DMG05_10050 [Acidobacteria bacterium]|nr:MAG: hypothetical protein DMG05_10050 [Acidobacteriota bacterium]
MMKERVGKNEASERQGLKKPRHRSPNYPTVGLRNAVERVGKLLKIDGKAGAPPEIAAVHIGFSKAHGQAMSVVSALKKFGLVQEMNKRIVPTQRAIEIVNLAADDPRRIKSLQEAVLTPEIYKELIDQHRESGFPANDAMERELITYKGFNPKSVSAFVRDFRDSLDFACLSDFQALELAEEGKPMEKQVLSKIGHVIDPPRPLQGLKDIPLPIPGTVWPILRGAFPMKEREWNQMMSLLEAMKPGLVEPDKKEKEQ